MKGRCLALICQIEWKVRRDRVTYRDCFWRGNVAAAKRPHQRQEGKETIISPPATGMAATDALHENLSDECKAVFLPLRIELAMRQRYDAGSVIL